MFESEFWAMFGRPSHHHLPHQQHHYRQQQQPLPPSPSPPPPPPPFPSPPRATWTRHEDKVFETALVSFLDGSPDRWVRIAAQLPGKDPRDVLEHYRALLQDVDDIDAGRIPPPDYDDDDEPSSAAAAAATAAGMACARKQISFGGKAREERKKGVPWTEEEHRRFLEGLEKYGKGDWRSISRNAVVTRTPTQVASHAQKYFIRLNSMGKKEKKRGSIHDITKP